MIQEVHGRGAAHDLVSERLELRQLFLSFVQHVNEEAFHMAL